MDTYLNQRRLVIGCAIGILIWINVLTIALSTWYFGYFDRVTAMQMGAIALPPLALGVILLNPFRHAGKIERKTASMLRHHLEAGR